VNCQQCSDGLIWASQSIVEEVLSVFYQKKLLIQLASELEEALKFRTSHWSKVYTIDSSSETFYPAQCSCRADSADLAAAQPGNLNRSPVTHLIGMLRPVLMIRDHFYLKAPILGSL
jgi:hypothetical protein